MRLLDGRMRGRCKDVDNIEEYAVLELVGPSWYRVFGAGAVPTKNVRKEGDVREDGCCCLKIGWKRGRGLGEYRAVIVVDEFVAPALVDPLGFKIFGMGTVSAENAGGRWGRFVRMRNKE